jgi:hypothetical protein
MASPVGAATPPSRDSTESTPENEQKDEMGKKRRLGWRGLLFFLFFPLFSFFQVIVRHPITQLVKLDFGGMKFTTSIDTLTNSQGSSFFK